jgi:hypothetical protein
MTKGGGFRPTAKVVGGVIRRVRLHPRRFARSVRADRGAGLRVGREGTRVVMGDWGRHVDGVSDALRGRAEAVTVCRHAV